MSPVEVQLADKSNCVGIWQKSSDGQLTLQVNGLPNRW